MSRLQRPAGVRTDPLGPPKLVTVKCKVATCWLVDRRQSYRVGLAMSRRGYLTLASSRPSQLARFLSSHMTIYKGTARTGHFRIPTTTGRSAC